MRARGIKRSSEETIREYVPTEFSTFPDSLPPLYTDSQRSTVVIDSQGVVSSEPGYGVQRDLLANAEKTAMVSDARLAHASAEAALKTANEMVRSALLQQELCKGKLLESQQLIYDLTGGR